MPQHHHQHPPTPAPKPNPKLLSLLLKAIIMTLLTSLFFLFLGLASAALLLLHLSLSHHRHRHRHRQPLLTALSPGIPTKTLNTLPSFKFKRSLPSNDAGDACVVCLDEFREGQCCRRLAECGHVFHRKCVDAWLVKVAACPICRTRLRLNAGPADSLVGQDKEEVKRFWGFRGDANLRVS